MGSSTWDGRRSATSSKSSSPNLGPPAAQAPATTAAPPSATPTFAAVTRKAETATTATVRYFFMHSARSQRNICLVQLQMCSCCSLIVLVADGLFGPGLLTLLYLSGC